ncbi:phasin family protein [Pannonibacter sp.]|uniref:phasin family protein n=1 Tax=Pannonibacter sp. TaxID=1906786 RepID=UPI003F723324
MSQHDSTQHQDKQSDGKLHDSSQPEAPAGVSVMDQVLSPAWLTQTPSNWSWAERSDKIEAQAFRSMEDARRRLTANAEKAVASHVDFVAHRLNADMECFRQLTACRLPDETMKTLQGFLRSMWQDYESQAQRSFALLQETLTETVASAEELTETAIETVVALESAVEEEVSMAKADDVVPATIATEAEETYTRPAPEQAAVPDVAPDVTPAKAAATSAAVKAESSAARPRKPAASKTTRKPTRPATPEA